MAQQAPPALVPTAPDPVSLLEVLKEELQYNPQLAVQSIARLNIIGRALGPERTRSALLP